MNLISIVGLTVLGLLSSFNCSAQASQKTHKLNSKNNNEIKYILFGIYTGECTHHCATMYRYNLTSNTNIILVDSTDSFFKSQKGVICKTPIRSIIKAKAAKRLADNIPNKIIYDSKSTISFGCPDCSDGGGIYFELMQGQRIKKFYIDYDTAKLSGYVKAFAESILATIEQIQKREK